MDDDKGGEMMGNKGDKYHRLLDEANLATMGQLQSDLTQLQRDNDLLRRQLEENITVKRRLREIIIGLEERIAALEAAIIKVREIEKDTNKYHGGIEDFAAIFGVALNEIAEVVNGVMPPAPGGDK